MCIIHAANFSGKLTIWNKIPFGSPSRCLAAKKVNATEWERTYIFNSSFTFSYSSSLHCCLWYDWRLHVKNTSYQYVNGHFQTHWSRGIRFKRSLEDDIAFGCRGYDPSVNRSLRRSYSSAINYSCVCGYHLAMYFIISTVYSYRLRLSNNQRLHIKFIQRIEIKLLHLTSVAPVRKLKRTKEVLCCYGVYPYLRFWYIFIREAIAR